MSCSKNPIYHFSADELKLFKEKVNSSKTIFILPHKNADPDALGSAQGLKLALQKLDKTVKIVTPDKPLIQFDCNYLVAEESNHLKPDLLITVDSASTDRFYYPEHLQSTYLINIDHHISNPKYGDLNIVKDAASTCEMILSLIIAAFGDDLVDTEICTSLLYGVLSDTLIFSTDSVTSETFETAGYLIGKGVDYNAVKEEVLDFVPLSTFKVWSNIISNGREEFGGQLLIVRMSFDYISQNKLNERMFVGLSSKISKLIDTNVIAVITEFERGDIKVSLRAKTLDVNKVAQELGGGGHKKASGFRAEGIGIEWVEESIIKEVGKQIN